MVSFQHNMAGTVNARASSAGGRELESQTR